MTAPDDDIVVKQDHAPCNHPHSTFASLVFSIGLLLGFIVQLASLGVNALISYRRWWRSSAGGLSSFLMQQETQSFEVAIFSSIVTNSMALILVWMLRRLLLHYSAVVVQKQHHEQGRSANTAPLLQHHYEADTDVTSSITGHDHVHRDHRHQRALSSPFNPSAAQLLINNLLFPGFFMGICGGWVLTDLILGMVFHSMVALATMSLIALLYICADRVERCGGCAGSDDNNNDTDEGMECGITADHAWHEFVATDCYHNFSG
jgi:hypothetical protein